MNLRSPRNLVAALGVLALLAVPIFDTGFFVSFVLTRTVILGLAASTIIFLSSYAGMVSLAQLLFVGIAGFMVGNAAGEAGSRGLKLGWDPWVAAGFALFVTAAVALLLGALSSRTSGIYFLMLTLTYAVIGYYFFGQVTTFSGFGGITGIRPPSFLDGEVARFYYLCVALSVLAYAGFRSLARSPFGLALQGVRDDSVRMASLGFNVALQRTLAFTLAGFVAGVAGVLNIWWNGQIDPTSISIGPTLDLLIVAVIGGIAHLEGAWLGAFVFVIANNYMRDLPFASAIGLTEARFNTVVGLLVLVIMILSPDGLVGVILRVRDKVMGGSGSGSAGAPVDQPDATGAAELAGASTVSTHLSEGRTT
jgi:branched-chain amino acid transport system permease protein